MTVILLFNSVSTFRGVIAVHLVLAEIEVFGQFLLFSAI